MIIAGSSFSSTVGSVYIGSVQATVVSWTDSQIEADIAAVPAGTQNLIVETDNGRATDG